MKAVCALSLVGIVCASSAAAQRVGYACRAFAQTVAAAYTTSFSETQFQAAKYYFNCGEMRGSSADEEAYWAFGLGPELDEAGRRAYCSKTLDAYNIAARDYNSTYISINEALNTIEQCNYASDEGWSLELERVTSDGLIVRITSEKEQGGDLLGIDVIPAGSLNCTPTPPIGPFHIALAKKFSVTCSRSRIAQMIDGVLVTYASAAGLSLRLHNTGEEERHIPITLPAYTFTDPNVTIKKLDVLQAEIDVIRKNFEAKFLQPNDIPTASGK